MSIETGGAHAFDQDRWMDELFTTLDAANRTESPSEVHGLITGAITNHLYTGVQPDLFAILTGESDNSENGDVATVFAQLYRETSDVLFETDFEFIMVLPDDSEDIDTKTEALAEWCQGYCLGLLYNDKLVVDELPDNGPEIIKTIIEVSQATVSEDVEQEEDEKALFEIQDFLRLAIHEVFNDVVTLRESEFKNKNKDVH